MSDVVELYKLFNVLLSLVSKSLIRPNIVINKKFDENPFWAELLRPDGSEYKIDVVGVFMLESKSVTKRKFWFDQTNRVFLLDIALLPDGSAHIYSLDTRFNSAAEQIAKEYASSTSKSVKLLLS